MLPQAVFWNGRFAVWEWTDNSSALQIHSGAGRVTTFLKAPPGNTQQLITVAQILSGLLRNDDPAVWLRWEELHLENLLE